ncbi:Uncharacterised protein [Mycobacteroides abscessus subsp. abscessus]|nr:Uncharacterised protein [Mycobacteroides abscessus subsp. abscessus]
MWEPGSTWSPGALDAAVHLAWELILPVAAAVKTTWVAKRRRDQTSAVGAVARRRR